MFQRKLSLSVFVREVLYTKYLDQEDVTGSLYPKGG